MKSKNAFQSRSGRISADRRLLPRVLAPEQSRASDRASETALPRSRLQQARIPFLHARLDLERDLPESRSSRQDDRGNISRRHLRPSLRRRRRRRRRSGEGWRRRRSSLRRLHRVDERRNSAHVSTRKYPARISAEARFLAATLGQSDRTQHLRFGGNGEGLVPDLHQSLRPTSARAFRRNRLQEFPGGRQLFQRRRSEESRIAQREWSRVR